MPALPVVPALLLAALSFQLPDSEGVRHTAAEFRQSKAVVFAFVSADGPMANGYAGTPLRGLRAPWCVVLRRGLRSRGERTPVGLTVPVHFAVAVPAVADQVDD